MLVLTKKKSNRILNHRCLNGTVSQAKSVSSILRISAIYQKAYCTRKQVRQEEQGVLNAIYQKINLCISLTLGGKECISDEQEVLFKTSTHFYYMYLRKLQSSRICLDSETTQDSIKCYYNYYLSPYYRLKKLYINYLKIRVNFKTILHNKCLHF